MNVFEKMIDDVFNVPQFQQYFQTQEGQKIICIPYNIDIDTLYTEYGVDTGVSFYLTCKVKDYIPKKGDKIIFKSRQYKIDNYSTDSFQLTYRIFLKELTAK